MVKHFILVKHLCIYVKILEPSKRDLRFPGPFSWFITGQTQLTDSTLRTQNYSYIPPIFPLPACNSGRNGFSPEFPHAQKMHLPYDPGQWAVNSPNFRKTDASNMYPREHVSIHGNHVVNQLLKCEKFIDANCRNRCAHDLQNHAPLLQQLRNSRRINK